MKKKNKLVMVLPLLAALCLIATDVLASDGEGGYSVTTNFVWRVINFVVFFGILWHFTGKLIKNYFAGRRQGIQDSLDSLDERRAVAKKRLAEVEQHIANLDAERKAILDESRAQAETLKKNIVAAAHKQAEQIVAQARLTAENEGRTVLAEVRATLADEIVDAAEKVLREKLGPADHDRLINNSLNKVVLQ